MRGRARRALRRTATAALAAIAVALGAAVPAVADDACAGLSTVACENLKPGTPQAQWDLAGAGDESLQGFTTQISAAAGESVDFKVKTTATSYSLEIYPLGWYQGTALGWSTSSNRPSRYPRHSPRA